MQAGALQPPRRPSRSSRSTGTTSTHLELLRVRKAAAVTTGNPPHLHSGARTPGAASAKTQDTELTRHTDQEKGSEENGFVSRVLSEGHTFQAGDVSPTRAPASQQTSRTGPPRPVRGPRRHLSVDTRRGCRGGRRWDAFVAGAILRTDPHGCQPCLEHRRHCRRACGEGEPAPRNTSVSVSSDPPCEEGRCPHLRPTAAAR